MVDLHIFNLTGKAVNYRRFIEKYLGYKIKIRLLREIQQTHRDILEDLTFEQAVILSEDLSEEFYGTEFAYVFEADSE